MYLRQKSALLHLMGIPKSSHCSAAPACILHMISCRCGSPILLQASNKQDLYISVITSFSLAAHGMNGLIRKPGFRSEHAFTAFAFLSGVHGSDTSLTAHLNQYTIAESLRMYILS